MGTASSRQAADKNAAASNNIGYQLHAPKICVVKGMVRTGRCVDRTDRRIGYLKSLDTVEMKSEYISFVIFVIVVIGAVIYFTRGVSVDIPYAFEGEDFLDIEFNPERKRLPPPELRLRIARDSEGYRQLYAWFAEYDGTWLKDDVVSVPNDITIRGNDLIINISGTEVLLAFNNKKGYLSQYRAFAQERDFDFLWDLMPG
jgi:hypothetical protein